MGRLIMEYKMFEKIKLTDGRSGTIVDKMGSDFVVDIGEKEEEYETILITQDEIDNTDNVELILKEYVGKIITITSASTGLIYSGKAVELQGPDESDSGEPEIGINYAGGITMFPLSDIENNEIYDKPNMHMDVYEGECPAMGWDESEQDTSKDCGGCCEIL